MMELQLGKLEAGFHHRFYYSIEHNSRLRKMYHLTQQGEAQIADFLESWQEMQKMYDFIRGEEA